VDSYKGNHFVDPLSEGETYFYTFFLSPWGNTGDKIPMDPVRFQITLDTKEETEAIKATLSRLEKKVSAEPEPSPVVAAALKELGVAIEYEDAIEKRGKILLADVETSDLSPEDKQLKAERIRDLIAVARAKSPY
jgi:hypothetical protein